ncbi:MAG: c-type cytochrome [Planctomycetes bacterium]|nr:c-type cytochrome [Planctomycetota bacterium]
MRTIQALAVVTAVAVSHTAHAQRIEIPHHQDRPPGPALSPDEAIAKITVPEGFRVELVAAEPDVVNPIAMCFDERGRVWITESLEYPRSSPGPGRDRVKVLEDTDRDGRADRVTVFADGLNIPSGIAVGYGGVWVANAPDILFLQDTDGDGKADTREVVVTGFGRHDTHELPNSLTWGPDGWLYGLNGVFNPAHVRYPEGNPNYDPQHPGWKFTCAMFRVHPRTRRFEVFAEGTSNPWGIAFDSEGSAFVSACVIDHLWHIVETGYYHRQAGAYPPHTWKIESIVDHKHQKAAYCGLCYFDSDAYPPEYRGLMYMGNIHGGCINVDRLRRAGSTYRATAEPDFLTANDAWFMPVSQKVGPDGCLYILDWYDRYHCYQDARRDPEGIDRLKGRLYRVRYEDSPRAPRLDLAKETDEQLIARLGSPNVYFRETAQRLLAERANPLVLPRLDEIIFDVRGHEQRANQQLPLAQRMHALWTRTSIAPPDDDFLRNLAHAYDEPVYRAWFYRVAGDLWPDLDGEAWQKRVDALLTWDTPRDPRVALEQIIAGSKRGRGPYTWQLSLFPEDPLIARIVWRHLKTILQQNPERWHLALYRSVDEEVDLTGRLSPLLARSLAVMTETSGVDGSRIGYVLDLILQSSDVPVPVKQECLSTVAESIRNGMLQDERVQAFRKALESGDALRSVNRWQPALRHEATMLRVLWGEKSLRGELADLFLNAKLDDKTRLDALRTSIAVHDESLLAAVDDVLSEPDAEFRAEVIAILGRHSAPGVADLLLEHYDAFEPEMRPKVIETLTQRAAWSKRLLSAIGEKQVPADALNANQVRRLLEQDDPELAAAVRRHWGTVRTERNPARERIVAEMRDFLKKNAGDPHQGLAVYKKVCGQCHKIYGEGQEVGPDITTNGRGSFEQLLSNVFDPNLVIGAAYQAQTVVTTEGRVLNGLVVEDNDQRIVLKMQGGKLETIPRGDVEISKQSKLSMMPEDLEKQLKPEEIADLFAFLTLTRPPSDPEARKLPLTEAKP